MDRRREGEDLGENGERGRGSGGGRGGAWGQERLDGGRGGVEGGVERVRVGFGRFGEGGRGRSGGGRRVGEDRVGVGRSRGVGRRGSDIDRVASSSSGGCSNSRAVQKSM